MELVKVYIYTVAYPDTISTSVYGLDDACHGLIKLVGSYKTGNDVIYGFIFSGTIK